MFFSDFFEARFELLMNFHQSSIRAVVVPFDQLFDGGEGSMDHLGGACESLAEEAGLWGEAFSEDGRAGLGKFTYCYDIYVFFKSEVLKGEEFACAAEGLDLICEDEDSIFFKEAHDFFEEEFFARVEAALSLNEFHAHYSVLTGVSGYVIA